MLATRWPDRFHDDGWFFELKWDGIRALSTWGGSKVVIRSRRGNDITGRYPELATAMTGEPMVLDGEIVAMGDDGAPSFGRLQQRMNLDSAQLVQEAVHRIPVTYVVFDVLYAGREVIGAPFEERRRILSQLSLPGLLVVPDVVRGDPDPLWSFVRERELEGIVAKRAASPYRPGTRSADWRKISRFRQIRTVVGGFTAGEGGRTGSFGSLVLGLWSDDGLRWIGSVGSGFDDGSLRAIRDALDQMSIESSPFEDPATIPGHITWVEPRLVAMVQYKEWTAAGRLRAPSFKGFTDDPHTIVTWDREGPESPG